MSNDRLNDIFDKTDGQCHLCHKILSFSNYAAHGKRGCWEIEHSIPKGKGGTDHLNNLFAACIPCNREKGTSHTRTIRKRYEQTRAPYSRAKKEQINNENILLGTVLGFAAGRAVGGQWGGLIGAVIGFGLGNG